VSVLDATDRPAVIDAHRDPAIESWLDSYGVKWEYTGPVDIDRFDAEKSLANQARVFEPLDEEVVTTYAEALKRGDQFPAVVANRPSARGRLTMIDGNHRYAAARRAELPQVPTYTVINAKKSTVVMMTFAANTRHGKPTSYDERVFQAVWLLNNGATQEEAAASVQLKKSDITKAWARVQADNRADEVGILRREWEALSHPNRQRLYGVITDEGFRAAAGLSFRANLDAQQVQELVGEVNKVRSSEKQVAVVKRFEGVWSEQIQDVKSGMGTHSRRKVTPKSTLRRALTSLSTLPENISLVADMFADQERQEAAKQARSAAAQLSAFAEQLEA
jgi:ParB-like chromosome segregation protein Spo0J